jgi:L-lactate permease
MRPWIKYLLIRLGIFIVVLIALLLANVNPFLATVVAAIAGLVISYIFFRGVRDQVAAELAKRSSKPEAVRNADTDAEDEALDRLE